MASQQSTAVAPPRVTSARGGARQSSRPRGVQLRRRFKAWLYILPAVAVYVGFAVWPALSTVQFSFYKWDGISPSTWVGFDNYVRVFQDPLLINAIGHGLILIVFFSFIPVVIALLMTALLLGKATRGMTFFRTVFFLPQVLPLVAVGITWRWLYNDNGLFNQVLEGVGLGFLARAWLGDYDLALIALGFIGTWCMSGLCMVLFLSGAQKIDPALFEAATLDGAGPFRQFLNVTIPGVRKEITIAGVITTIAALASFDLVFVTTNGGPADQTSVPALLVYRLAFNEGNIGGASALAVTLTVLVIVIVSTIRFLAREERE